MTVLVLLFYDDGAEAALVLVNCVAQQRQQFLRVPRTGYDPGVEVLAFLVSKQLAEIDQEFKGIVTNLKMVRIPSLHPTAGL